MTSLCEFLVVGVNPGAPGLYHLTGYCGDSPLRVSDVFDRIEHPQDSGRLVRLRVVRIEAYQRSLEELGAGMSARIDVEGDGLEFIRPHAALVVTDKSQENAAAAAAQSTHE